MHSCQRPDPGSEYLIHKFSLRTDIKCLMFVLRLSTMERSELENLDKELKALNKKFKSLSSKLNIKNKQIQDAGFKFKNKYNLFCLKDRVFASNSNWLISISLQPGYFKLWLNDITEFIV